MTCTRARSLMNDYIDGALPERWRQGTAVHLHGCTPCSRILKQLRCTRRLLSKLPPRRMPLAMKNSIMQQYRTHGSPSAASTTDTATLPRSGTHTADDPLYHSIH